MTETYKIEGWTINVKTPGPGEYWAVKFFHEDDEKNKEVSGSADTLINALDEISSNCYTQYTK